MKPNDDVKNPTIADISETFAISVEEIWSKAGGVTKLVLQIIKSFHEKYMNLMKPFNSRQKQENYRAKLASFKLHSRKQLFDIVACKYLLFVTVRKEAKFLKKNKNFFTINLIYDLRA